jgi:hypothetical protein
MEIIKWLTYILNMVLPKLYLNHNIRFRLSVASYSLILSEITDMLTHFEIINDYAECISECLNQLISMNG